MWNPFGKPKPALESLELTFPRDEIVRRSRILVVDDERPELIGDLQKVHFSVDHVPDITQENVDIVEKPLYDLILLDFGSVGRKFGADEGLALLRHIRRVNPMVKILAYTSKAIGSGQADFYRLADGVLPKDAGIAESTLKIEQLLREAYRVDNLWRAFLGMCGVTPGSQTAIKIEKLIQKGVKGDTSDVKGKLAELTGQTPGDLAMSAVGKISEVLIKAAIAG